MPPGSVQRTTWASCPTLGMVCLGGGSLSAAIALADFGGCQPDFSSPMIVAGCVGLVKFLVLAVKYNGVSTCIKNLKYNARFGSAPQGWIPDQSEGGHQIPYLVP